MLCAFIGIFIDIGNMNDECMCFVCNYTAAYSAYIEINIT